jgi:hypothetical protein
MRVALPPDGSPAPWHTRCYVVVGVVCPDDLDGTVLSRKRSLLGRVLRESVLT